MILKFYQFWFEPPPTPIATLQLANRNAFWRLNSSLREPTPTTPLLSSQTHADDSNVSPSDSNISPSELWHFTFWALTFHHPSSDTEFAPTCQAEKPPRFGKGCRNRHLPMVMAKRFDSFFFLFFFFPWFVHFSHFGLWNIFDSAVWITWKTKKSKTLSASSYCLSFETGEEIW